MSTLSLSSRSINPLGAHGRGVLRKLAEGLENVTIVIVGDSTSAANTWVIKLVEALAALFPAYTVKYADWTDPNTSYNELITKQTGSGSKTLTIWNCSVPGTNAHYHMAPNFEAMISSKQPDLLYFAHGHNHGAAAAEPFWRDALIVTTQEIQRACPLTEIVLIATNPRTDANKTLHRERARTTERVAMLSGFGFIDIHKAFLEADPNSTILLENEIHPNQAGYTLWANEVLKLMSVNAGLRPQGRSTLETVMTTALANGDFSSFAAPPVLPSWTAVNTVLSKDVTNIAESVNGYAVEQAVNTPGSLAYMVANLNGNALKKFTGRWVALLTKSRAPVGSDFSVGQVLIAEQNGASPTTATSDSLADSNGKLMGVGGYRWFMCSKRIASDCTNVNFIIRCSSTGVAGQKVSTDRAILVPGVWPHDIR